MDGTWQYYKYAYIFVIDIHMFCTILNIQCVPKFPRQLCYPFSQLYVDESQKLFDLLVAHTGRFVLVYKEA